MAEDLLENSLFTEGSESDTWDIDDDIFANFDPDAAVAAHNKAKAAAANYRQDSSPERRRLPPQATAGPPCSPQPGGSAAGQAKN
jgi:D-alanyl-D-alanine carboxypeptidase